MHAMSDRALLYCAGGGIGDSLVASLVARALRRRFGRVDALTLPAHAPLLERVPDVDGVLLDDGADDAALAQRLAGLQYGACVVTWATRRTASVPQRAAIPVRVGQARRFYSFRFTDRVVVRSERGDVTSHWSQILLDFARAIDCDTDEPYYRFVPTERDELEAGALLADTAPFILLNPCNAVASARGIWPLDGWAALARELRERFGGADLGERFAGRRTDGRRHRPTGRSTTSRRSRAEPASEPSELWRSAPPPSSASPPARCTSPPRSSARRSGSFHFSPTTPIAGRRWAAGPKSCARRIRAIAETPRSVAGIMPASPTSTCRGSSLRSRR